MLISLSIRVELYQINILYNYKYASIFCKYCKRLCQLSFEFMIVFTPICDNERVVFLQMTTQIINPSTKQYIYNSLLIS